MKLSTSLKTAAAAGIASIMLAGPVVAHDHYHDHHHDGSDVVIGIIGEVIGGAIEKKHREREYRERCERLYYRCEDGIERACRRFERNCE